MFIYYSGSELIPTRYSFCGKFNSPYRRKLMLEATDEFDEGDEKESEEEGD